MKPRRTNAAQIRGSGGYYYYGGKANWLLLLAAFALAGIGILFIFELTPVGEYGNDQSYYAVRQGVFGICGGLCAVMVSKLDYHRLRSICAGFFGLAVILVLLLRIPGLGSGRFLAVGDMMIDVPSLLMLAACLMLVKILYNKNDFSVVLKALGCTTASSVLFIAASDTKSVFCFLVIAWIMIFIRNSKYGLLLGTVLSAGSILLIRSAGAYLNRIEVWLDPFRDPYGSGYETIASLYTTASGGALGAGLGDGKAACYLADARTTYMMSGIVREMGWVGAMLVIALYLVFLIAAVQIACKARDRFGFYLAAVITVRFAVMLVLNLFVTVNLIPPVGISLPFVSCGGSALAVDLMLVGILLSISRCGATQIEV